MKRIFNLLNIVNQSLSYHLTIVKQVIACFWDGLRKERGKSRVGSVSIILWRFLNPVFLLRWIPTTKAPFHKVTIFNSVPPTPGSFLSVLVSLTGVSGANPVETSVRAGTEGSKTGNWRSLFQVSILRVSNLFKRLGFMRGVKEVKCA